MPSRRTLLLVGLPLLLAGSDGLSGAPMLTSIVFEAMAEPLLMPLTLALVCGAHLPLPRPLVVAAFLSYSRVLVALVNVISAQSWQRPVLMVCSAGALAVAVLLLLVGGRLERALFLRA